MFRLVENAMSISLTLKKAYLSITNLPETTLPDFTLISGINGTGKTHLLRAIENGAVSLNFGRNARDEIKYFDWTSFVPNKERMTDRHNVVSQHANLWEQLKTQRTNCQGKLIDWARAAGFQDEYLKDTASLCNLGISDVEEMFGQANGKEKFEQLQDQIAQVADRIKSKLNRNRSNSHWVEKIHASDSRGLFLFDKHQFYNNLPLAFDSIDPFRYSLAKLFLAYSNMQRENALREVAAKRGDKSVAYLSEAEFVNQHGEPPWDFVNQILKNAGLQFHINSPDFYTEGPFLPVLTKNGSGADIGFDNLSSGEKVLMSIALCLYQAEDSRQVSMFPKLLLLDEIDAPLHPSMSTVLLRTITETLVDQHGISVLMTTHSPSTVAVAPEDSIHVMRPEIQGVFKVSKDEALSVLTHGVPTLSISHDGRRQVFVESKHDEAIYTELFAMLKEKLKSPISLTFLAVGHDKEGGCAKVREIVNKLASFGNKSVFGLVDWDTQNNPNERIFVLGKSGRYAIENLLFEPLTVAALLIRDVQNKCEEIGWDKTKSVSTFTDSAPEMLQQIVETVEERLGFDLKGTRKTISYSGFELQVLKEACEFDAHQLEATVLDVFPQLKKFAKNPGNLKLHIVKNVYRDCPRIIPKEFLETFKQIVSAQVIN